MLCRLCEIFPSREKAAYVMMDSERGTVVRKESENSGMSREELPELHWGEWGESMVFTLRANFRMRDTLMRLRGVRDLHDYRRD